MAKKSCVSLTDDQLAKLCILTKNGEGLTGFASREGTRCIGSHMRYSEPGSPASSRFLGKSV
jgi:hypothetical protein